MVLTHEDSLSAVLSEFARTLLTDFPIQRILDHLVDRIVDILPISSAGVTLISEDLSPRYIAASDTEARKFERLQTEMGEGPCLMAYTTGQPVSVPDLASDQRFPRFTPAALAAGLGAVFTFPLCHDDARFGALDLYRKEAGGLDEEAMATAQTLADVAAAYLLNAKSRDDALATSDQFHHEAMHDTLTGLPNRLLFQERLEHAANRAKRTHTSTAVLFLDLDHFKDVNDTFGHVIGDELLIAVSSRLSGLIRASDTLARFSGDEFVFLCEEVHGADDVALLASRIDQTFETPFRLAGSDVTVRASVGTAFVGPGEAITPDLLIRADKAMYRAKRTNGVGPDIIDVGDAQLRSDDETLEAELRIALAKDELEVAYQPIVRSADASVVGVEALLRWTHPRRGPIPPLVIVPLAEHSGLIVEIGAWILERACTDRAKWIAEHPDHSSLDLAVNVSVRQLLVQDFCGSVSAILERTGMDPSCLILELTESIVMEHSARIMLVLFRLNQLGIRLALDDFGTGYSSLSYLGRLPIQIMKIDRGFIAAIDGTPGRIVVSAVTDLAHALGISVVAEGVETATQRDETVAVGCDFAQGYFYGYPMPADSIQLLLSA
jgi:diguanylate cyclase (GGDEF)-like protein